MQILFVGGKIKGRAVIFFYAAAIALVCPTAKLRLEWLALNRPNWLPFKPALTAGQLRQTARTGRLPKDDTHPPFAASPSEEWISYGPILVPMVRDTSGGIVQQKLVFCDAGSEDYFVHKKQKPRQAFRLIGVLV